MTDSAVKMARRDGADGTTVTAEHKALLDDVAVEQGRKAIVATIPNNSNTHTSFGAWSPVHARARRADRVAR